MEGKEQIATTKARSRPGIAKAEASIFIVDDHPVIRHGLNQLLSREEGFEVVGEAAGAPEAIGGINKSKPDLVIVDLTLADGGGLDLIKDIRAQWPHIKILVASMHNEAMYAERAMRAGALGYVTKDQPQQQVLEAVRSVLQDHIYICPELSDALMHRALRSDDGIQANPIESLSNRELEVFELLGEGLRTREIAERLSLSVKTIETYRDNIKAKLSLNNSTELVHRAVRWKLEQKQ